MGDRVRGWSDLLGDVRVIEMQGGHISCSSIPDNVELVAAHLEQRVSTTTHVPTSGYCTSLRQLLLMAQTRMLELMGTPFLTAFAELTAETETCLVISDIKQLFDSESKSESDVAGSAESHCPQRL